MKNELKFWKSKESWECRQFTRTVFRSSVDRFLMLVCHVECKQFLNRDIKLKYTFTRLIGKFSHVIKEIRDISASLFLSLIRMCEGF